MPPPRKSLFGAANPHAGRNPAERIATYARYPRYPQPQGAIFRFARLGFIVQVQLVIGTEVPASPEGRKRQKGAAGDGRTDLHRMAMRRNASSKSDHRKRRRKSWRYLLQLAVPFGGQATRRVPAQEGPQKVSEPAFGQDQKLEATPDLVSQDRVAEDPRVVRLANTGRS